MLEGETPRLGGAAGPRPFVDVHARADIGIALDLHDVTVRPRYDPVRASYQRRILQLFEHHWPVGDHRLEDVGTATARRRGIETGLQELDERMLSDRGPPAGTRAG